MKRGLIVSFAKTSRGTRTDSLPPSSRHWKDWVTALRQEFSARPKSAPATGASDSSSWPTARKNDPQKRGDFDTSDPRNGLPAAAVRWATPSDISKRGGSQHPDKRTAGGHAVNLEDQAEHWSTPRASDGEKGSPNQSFGAGGEPLTAQAMNWATPQARDHMPAHTPDYVLAKKAAGHGMRNLNDEAANWPSPTTRIFKGGGTAVIRKDGRSRMDQLDWAAEAWTPLQVFATELLLLPDRPTPSGTKSAETRRSLNPLFVEWLMGWPEGLSGFAPSATVFAPWLRLMRGELSRLCLPVTPDQGLLL
jgi:hypothetical protein